MKDNLLQLYKEYQYKGYREPIDLRVMRYTATPLLFLCIKLGFKSPNIITSVWIVLSLFTGLLAINGNFITASALFLFALLFDYFDGGLARYLNKVSELGEWIDIMGHNVIYPYIFITFGIGHYLINDDTLTLALALYTALMITMVRSVYNVVIVRENKDIYKQPQSHTVLKSVLLNTRIFISILSRQIAICIAFLFISLLFSDISYVIVFYSVFFSFLFLAKVFMSYKRLRDSGL